MRFTVRPPAEMDDHWPVETPEEYERRFGRGYTILFSIFFVSVLSLIVYVGMSPHNSAEVFRRIGLLIIDFGCGFLAGLVYQCIVVKAFANVARRGGVMQTRIITPQTNPIRYWAIVVIGSIVMLGLVIGGVWLYMHAGFVASRLQG